jgi:hypothetical protein
MASGGWINGICWVESIGILFFGNIEKYQLLACLVINLQLF